ncbi:MAG: hypothetical protein AAGG68_18935 [Bacteroidota bacterium]
MKRAILSFTIIVLLAVLTTAVVNFTGKNPTHEYSKDHCTRYCHDRHCPHFKAKVVDKNSLALNIQPAYQTAIRALKYNPIGLSYTTINLLVFVLGFPVLIFFLSFNLWRKWKD